MRTINHAEAHELIADLALERGALADLVSTAGGSGGTRPEVRGSTELDPESLGALRAHVDACPDCRRDVDAWLETHARLDDATRAGDGDRSGTLAELASERPIAAPRDLRDRIQAEVARRPRAAGAPAGVPAQAPSALPPVSPPETLPAVSAPVPASSPASPRPAGRGSIVDLGRWTRAWRVALPLVAALAIVVGGLGVIRDQSSRLDSARAETAELRTLATSLDRLLADPSHRVVALAAAGGAPGGTLAWSKHDIVVMSTALAAPPAGSEYRCWLERDGVRTRVGTMWFAGDLAYWSGSIDEWATISFDGGGTFGVSLEKAGAQGAGTPVLLGDLGS